MNYYNEYDKGAAQWLRELIAAGEIPAGHVDERSIVDVRFSDLAGYTQCHFFAGIGGWSYALRLAGWPEDRPVWTGSCPCQPFSTAGKQMGRADPRHLWPAFRRLINKCRPPVVFGEQVASAAGREWLAGVRSDLETMGYAVGASDLCAAGVGAPHIRQRLYWLADSAGGQCEQLNGAQGDVLQRSTDDCTACGLADSQHAERREVDRPVQDVVDRRGAAGRCSSCGLGDSTSDGCEVRGYLHGGMPGQGSCEGRHPRRLGNPYDPGPQGRHERGLGTGQQSPWASSVALACTDGKTRRVEPCIFPLVARIPGSMVPSGDPSVPYAQASAEARVGRIRGYGNAITPQCAQAFIEAYLDL